MKGPWDIGDIVFDVLLGGESVVDARLLFDGEFSTPESIDHFLEAYGFDLNDPIEIAELQGHLAEAIRFIRQKFLQPGNPSGYESDIPKKILDMRDVRELFALIGREDLQSEMCAWACSVLKVMHVLSHLDRDVRVYYFGEIQTQILDRFYRVIHRDELGNLYMGRSATDPFRVDLVAFEVKPKKTRESLIVKLLQKAESVAEEVFDRIGIRLITKNRVDAVRAVHFLEANRIVVAANIKPSRSRNTLIDRFAFKDLLPQAREKQDWSLLDAIPAPPLKDADNRFSSQHYRSIQFTGRKLIKVRNPVVDQVREIRALAKQQGSIDESGSSSALLGAIDRLDTKQVPRVVRFFFPFEVQIVDELSHQENEKGRSAHAEYKSAQMQVAMHRVLRGVIRARQA
jgi:uncharacterized protein (TIGR04562 family)